LKVQRENSLITAKGERKGMSLKKTPSFKVFITMIDVEGEHVPQDFFLSHGGSHRVENIFLIIMKELRSR
jgi:hypothetical protein